jgi:hypothetical protein
LILKITKRKNVENIVLCSITIYFPTNFFVHKILNFLYFISLELDRYCRLLLDIRVRPFIWYKYAPFSNNQLVLFWLWNFQHRVKVIQQVPCPSLWFPQETYQHGTDVMILKIFSPKNDHNIGFWEKRQNVGESCRNRRKWWS